MCGIFSLLNANTIAPDVIQNFQKGKLRGPEVSIIRIFLNSIILGFHRLAINGLTKMGDQPLNISNCVLICNGEIYNYKHLYSLIDVKKFSQSDCEIIIHLYKKYGIFQTLQMLDGVFAFVLLDLETKEVFIARDTFGVRPLFKSFFNNNVYGFTSEMKTVVDLNPINVIPFKPGTFSKFIIKTIKTKAIWKPIFNNKPFTIMNNSIDYTIKDNNMAYRIIKEKLEQAVFKRVLTTERPIACLLSGGLDSSLITALVKKYYPKDQLETYSIGLKGSEDLRYAQMVADFLQTKHTEIVVTEENFLAAIPETIRAIESFDTTTVRASVGNYLVSKYIKEHSEAKVIFNGDGADEVAGGYLYFHAAPDPIEFDKENRRLLTDIHLFDVLRSDRSISSNGLEPRTPFLDKSFVQTYLSIPPNLRAHGCNGQCEKFLLRKAFENDSLLPKEVLFRQKEGFSDGVSTPKKAWYEIIADHVKTDPTVLKIINTPYSYLKHIKREKNSKGDFIYLPAFNPPKTLEQIYYRKLFCDFYKDFCEGVPYFWMPKFIKNATDASARTLKFHKKSEKQEEQKQIPAAPPAPLPSTPLPSAPLPSAPLPSAPLPSAPTPPTQPIQTNLPFSHNIITKMRRAGSK
jgi:asparagine synthase (glutamine-hydrolysing)